jgi:hypothetical protein
MVLALLCVMPWIHMTARTLRPYAPLCEPEHAGWLWGRLRATFPVVAASALLPNHPHAVPWVDDPRQGREAFGRLLGHFRRRLGLRRPLWEPVSRIDVIDDPKMLARTVRYVALNPCRAELVRDPLEWLWSTHRDVVGAVVDPWVTAESLARALGRHQDGFVERFHAYVSGDPSVNVAGTRPPMPAREQPVPREPLESIAAAAVAATRGTFADLERRGATRRLFVLLARHQGWRDTSLIASMCDMTPRTIRRLAHADDLELLAAGAMCLGDDRLLRAVKRPDETRGHSTPLRRYRKVE